MYIENSSLSFLNPTKIYCAEGVCINSLIVDYLYVKGILVMSDYHNFWTFYHNTGGGLNISIRTYNIRPKNFYKYYCVLNGKIFFKKLNIFLNNIIY